MHIGPSERRETQCSGVRLYMVVSQFIYVNVFGWIWSLSNSVLQPSTACRIAGFICISKLPVSIPGVWKIIGSFTGLHLPISSPGQFYYIFCHFCPADRVSCYIFCMYCSRRISVPKSLQLASPGCASFYVAFGRELFRLQILCRWFCIFSSLL